jgi:hypothetical protein
MSDCFHKQMTCLSLSDAERAYLAFAKVRSPQENFASRHVRQGRQSVHQGNLSACNLPQVVNGRMEVVPSPDSQPMRKLNFCHASLDDNVTECHACVTNTHVKAGRVPKYGGQKFKRDGLPASAHEPQSHASNLLTLAYCRLYKSAIRDRFLNYEVQNEVRCHWRRRTVRNA